MKEDLISDINSYYCKINNNVESILKSYIALIEEFLSLSPLMTSKITDKNYAKYVILNGIVTLNHVFNLLLLYTKNIQLVVTHSQKALFYYAEFISQIGETNAFLQLTSHDAALFVYKKTIYEINKDHFKNVDKDDNNKLIQIKYYYHPYPHF